MLVRKDNIVMQKADAYTDRIIKMTQYLKDVRHEYVLSGQILRSGTSIGANIAESRNAQGSKDFVNKLNIALKEADETGYWLEKLKSGGYLKEIEYQSMFTDNEEIIKLLTSIIKTMKERIYNGKDKS
jgi:four helix bundle protein